MVEKIALIGAGIMGTAIASRLLECGHTVHVFDVDAAKVGSLVKQGAYAENNPADATAKSDFVILSLNHAEIVRKVVFGKSGIAESATTQKLLIDMSSIDPAATSEMAALLKEKS